MELRKQKVLFIAGLIIILSVLTAFTQSDLNKDLKTGSDSFPIPSINHFDYVTELLDSKLNDYDSLGYFPQIYQPSLQATYYALYILDHIGRLSDIDQSRILNYIMSLYNQNSYTFADEYSQRYLDMDVSKTYYPYASLLEVNCYAILSLEILNGLNQINEQESIDFIWSCYQPITSGFIGQPYDSELPDYFKVSTMDNTYFAIKTLDFLMSDWTSYLSEKNEVIQYIQNLQSTNTFYWYFGGFENDEDPAIDTLDMFEPNLLSSYYCLASLDNFGMVDTINLANFYDYLDGLYDSISNSFQMSHFAIEDYGNIVGTSLGLITSDLTSFPGINRNEVIQFILDNRNNKGIWNYSTEYLYCELIDTFQVIRSLSDSGELSQLSENDKDLISIAVSNFNSYFGFSLLSEDYTSINLLNTIVNSFDLYNRLDELDKNFLYSIIENSLVYYSVSDCEGFLGCLTFEDSLRKYRSFPLEFYYSGNHQHYQHIGTSLVSHQSTFQALDSLQILGKMSVLDSSHNLNELLYSILNSQFLEAGYENYGGFLPFLTYSLWTPELQNETIFIDYSYYAISSMEILSNYLGLGSVSSLDFDITALYNYIHNRIFEDTNYQYYSTHYSTLPEIIIQNTFYSIYILKSLDLYDLDEEKITNFVLDYINYSNIKSVYYSYKISELLTEEIPFDYDLIYNLIGDIYSEELKEYYTTTDKSIVEQEILLWISDLVINELRYSTCSITIDNLGACRFLSVDNNITFTINSKYSGTFWYWIDGYLVDSGSFYSNGDTFVYILDDYTDTITDYSVKINATALDGSYGEIVSTFFVYSDSSTLVNITSLSGYKFLSTGNTITFHIQAEYSGTYWYWIDGELVDTSNFNAYGETFVYSLDDYTDIIKDYTVKINATGLDNNYGEALSVFSVYSSSSTLVNITSLKNCKFLSTENNITFHIQADYNGTYWYWVDGILINSDIFLEGGQTFIYSLDGFATTIKDYTVKVNATALDGHYGEATAIFSVYSDSSTLITIDQLNDYEFMTTGNNITFHINSEYPDQYNFSIDGIEISSGLYNNGQIFTFSLDGYSVGIHNITIWAIGLDELEGIVYTSFTVFSNSETIIIIYSIDNYIFNTVGNIVNFSISSAYPDTYRVKVDGLLIDHNSYISNDPIQCSIDGYSVGTHTLLIWANSSDEKESMLSIQFSVFSHSYIEIDIIDLPNYEFQTIGNEIIFYINSSFPDTVRFFIDNSLNWSGPYNHSGQYFALSIDGYNVSEHLVTIWANSTDGSEGSLQSSFTVYSLSNTIIKIAELPDYEFLTTGHNLRFNISSFYPDYFTVYIDGLCIDSGSYISGQYNIYTIDGYPLGNHSVYIWAIGLDGKVGIASAQFDVYSTSITIINITSIPNYIFMSTGNIINFSISSKYTGKYNITIDNVLVDYDSFIPGHIITYQIDGYAVGEHSVIIFAKSIDSKIAVYTTTFNVYSNSSTIITIYDLKGYEFLSIGNFLNFSIFSRYPDYYKLWIDGILAKVDNYSNGNNILFSLDNYTSTLGNHTVEIWAIGLDLEESHIFAEFNVYSTSVTLISIHELEGCEFLSLGNYLNFSISTNYPDYFELWINGELVLTNSFESGEHLSFSLDNYTKTLGNNTLYIWAIGLDGKEAAVIAQFSVFSTSSTTISIISLNDIEFLSNNNTLIFSIHSIYPDYFELWIDGILLHTDTYENDNLIFFSLDNYSSIIGTHTIYILAKGLDEKIGTVSSEFKTFSSSNISIKITYIADYEINSTGNNINFSIFSEYPDYFNLFINNDSIASGIYYDGENFTISIDGYGVGTHNITIWARGRDGKEVKVFSSFTVHLTREKATDEGDELGLTISSILIIIFIGGPSIILIGSSYYLRKNNIYNSLKQALHKKKKS